MIFRTITLFVRPEAPLSVLGFRLEGFSSSRVLTWLGSGRGLLYLFEVRTLGLTMLILIF